MSELSDDEKLQAMVDAYMAWSGAWLSGERDRTWAIYCIARDAYEEFEFVPIEGTFDYRF
jgi:hypothetical protein